MRSFITLSIFYSLSTLALATTTIKPVTQQKAVVNNKGSSNASVPVAGNSKLSTASNITIVADLEVSGSAISGRTAKLVGVKTGHAPAGRPVHPIDKLTVQNTKGLKALIEMEYLSVQAFYTKTYAIDLVLLPIGKGKHTPGGEVPLVKNFMHLDKDSKTSPNSITKQISLTSGICGEYSKFIIISLSLS